MPFEFQSFKMIQLHGPKTGMCVQKYKCMLPKFIDAYNTCMYYVCMYEENYTIQRTNTFLILAFLQSFYYPTKEATNKLPPSCDL